MHKRVKLVSFRSFSRSSYWKHETKSCIGSVFLAAHQHPATGIEKERSRRRSQYEPSHIVTLTAKRHCREDNTLTLAPLRNLHFCIYSLQRHTVRQKQQKTNVSTQKILFFVSAHNSNTTNKVEQYDLWTFSRSNSCCSKLLQSFHEQAFSITENRWHRMKKVLVYVLLLSPCHRLFNRTRLPRTFLCISQKSHITGKVHSVFMFTQQILPGHVDNSNVPYFGYPYCFSV